MPKNSSSRALKPAGSSASTPLTAVAGAPGHGPSSALAPAATAAGGAADATLRAVAASALARPPVTSRGS